MIRIGMTEGMYILNLNGKEAEKIFSGQKDESFSGTAVRQSQRRHYAGYL